jgi:hypothetical protein
MMNLRRSVAPAAAVFIAASVFLAGCGSSSPGGATGSPTDSPASSPASSGTPSSGAAAPAPQPTATTAAHSISAYFYSTLANDRLAAVPRSAGSAAVLEESMRALMAGPTTDERSSGMSSQIPSSVRLQKVKLEHGVATIELAGSTATWSDAALAQLVFTATQFATVQGVRVEADEHFVTPHDGHGDRPLTRADFETLSPQVLVESPLYGQTVHSPVRIVGTANTFEAVFHVEITDWDGRVVATQRAMATSGSGTRGTFDITVPYTVDRAGQGELITFVYSAKDGSRIVISETPLHVAP